MRNTIPALTGIRFVAAFMVLLNHLVPVTGMGWFDELIKSMNVGVTIFFVLSGFLIAFRYFDEYAENPKWKRQYVVYRVARVFPMYALVTCGTFIVLWHSAKDPRELMKTFVLNLTMLRGFSGKYVYTGVSQGWTLTVEEVFYFLAPFIFLWSRKIPLLLQTLLFLLFGLATLYWSGLMSVREVWICTFFGRSFEFLCGIYLFFVIRKGTFKPRFRVTWVAGLLALGLIVVLSRLSYAPYTYAIQNPIGLGVNIYILPVAIALLFWGLIHERTWLQRMLSTKVFEVLGRSSYTLYLIHYGAFTGLIHSYITKNFFLVVLILQVTAILAWKFIEEPLNHYIKDAFRRRKPGPHPPVAKSNVL
ncbi:MAG: acyltransferase [Bacteroidota bacterium]|nr:acyltransferase [Bacteroidota bacterium]MDP4218730.1 acyltransferase [Bacteroidota bacterium]MDP4248103.1 acyltransferase [Bacteroidota bacterium]MDP4254774.1 acyltransferase [Bacteroidota bacterium]MDP4258038.1 acyltransferase [Bacteroidota bacterium]